MNTLKAISCEFAIRQHGCKDHSDNPKASLNTQGTITTAIHRGLVEISSFKSKRIHTSLTVNAICVRGKKQCTR